MKKGFTDMPLVSQMKHIFQMIFPTIDQKSNKRNLSTTGIQKNMIPWMKRAHAQAHTHSHPTKHMCAWLEIENIFSYKSLKTNLTVRAFFLKTMNRTKTNR